MGREALSLRAYRRTDLQRLRFDDCHPDGYMYLIQSKTHKHGTAAYLRIPMNLPVAHSETGARTLQSLIQRCRDTINYPYVRHERPSRIVASKEGDHRAQAGFRTLGKMVHCIFHTCCKKMRASLYVLGDYAKAMTDPMTFRLYSSLNVGWGPSDE